MLAIRTVAVVALRSQDGFAHEVDLVARDETDDVGQPWKRLGVAMTHRETATDGDVVADEVLIFDDRNEAKIIGENIDIVRRWQREARLEFARQIRRAV